MGGWNMWIATSTLHKALRRGDVETAAYAAGWLATRGDNFRASAWRRVLAMPAEDLCGEGAERVAALHYNEANGHELDNLFAAIIYLCEVVTARAGVLDRRADELKNATLYWLQGGREVKVPEYAKDVHAGMGTLADWWADVNASAPASPWREDAQRYVPEKQKPSPQMSLPECSQG